MNGLAYIRQRIAKLQNIKQHFEVHGCPNPLTLRYLDDAITRWQHLERVLLAKGTDKCTNSSSAPNAPS